VGLGNVTLSEKKIEENFSLLPLKNGEILD
jgi:hypothetical protein